MLFHQSWQSLACITLAAACSASSAADRLILRNLDIIAGPTVTGLDEDGVLLDTALQSGRTRIPWDEIERGRIALDQPRFDALLADLGLPLYRVRQRLKIGDLPGAGEVAEKLYPRFRERRSQTAYLVVQAVLWSRLDSGQLEQSVEPALRCFELLRSQAATTDDLPGSRRPKFDMNTGLCGELPPIWLDPQAAHEALPEVEATVRAMSQPRPISAYLYYATLAVAAGQTSEADRVLPSLQAAGGQLTQTRHASEGIAPALVDLVKAQEELAGGDSGLACERLRRSRVSLPPACQPAASLLLGRLDVKSDNDDRIRDGLLELLSLPAAHGDELRELSAAALYESAQALDKLKEDSGAAAVRGELFGRFRGTRFASQTSRVSPAP
jgi:hypothetical protein